MARSFLRRLSVRQRLIALVALLSALTASTLPLQVVFQRRAYAQRQAAVEAYVDVQQLTLQAIADVAQSRMRLLSYLAPDVVAATDAAAARDPSAPGDTAVAEEALAYANAALTWLDGARVLAEQAEMLKDVTSPTDEPAVMPLALEVQALRGDLADYQVLVGQVQRAEEASQFGDANSQVRRRLGKLALDASDGLIRRLDALASENESRLASSSAQQRQAERRGTIALLGMDLALVLVALLLSLVLVRSVTRPLAEMSSAAAQFDQATEPGRSSGAVATDAESVVTMPVEGRDEFTLLAHVYNRLVDHLRQVRATLEQRVAERTYEVERRSRYVQAVIDVSQRATDILHLEDVLQTSVDVIKDRFQLSYVGLFLVDEAREAIVLRAGTGEAGKRMLSQGHQLAYNQGMVGWSVASGLPRLSLEASDDPIRYASQELPATRLEAAIPMRVRGQRDRVIGALTVQATELGRLCGAVGAADAGDTVDVAADRGGAFDEEAVDLLQVIADLLATTIENARLCGEEGAALPGAEEGHGQMTRTREFADVAHPKGRGDSVSSWMRLPRVGPQGYRVSDRGEVEAVSGPPAIELREALQTGDIVRSAAGLALPIVVRGETLGAVRLERSGSAWTDREIALLQTVIEQLGVALDSARLYEGTQRSAARERATRQITDHMRATLDWDDLTQTAVQEIGHAVQASANSPVRVFVQWVPPGADTGPGEPTARRAVAGADAVTGTDAATTGGASAGGATDGDWP